MNELEEHEHRVAFEKKYVLRSEYERDLKLARHDGVVTGATFCIFIMPIVLVVILLIFQNI